MARKKKIKRKITDIEQILFDILKEEGIPYVREYRLGTYNVDAYIPSAKLSIQCDGPYFHSYCSKCTDYKKPNPRQKFRQQKDVACIAFHKHHEVSIMRFCGCELHNQKEEVREKILKGISETSNGNLVYRKRLLPELK